jgi:hypothetical protein
VRKVRKTRNVLTLGMLGMALVVLAGCAAGPNDLANRPREGQEVAGFWQGLWHGIIAPITFVISLFSDNVSMYEVHNNGNWYNFGFLLGVGTVWGGGGGSAAAKRRD